MRKPIALLAIAAAVGALLVQTSAPALAHGSMVWPGSRTYLCYQDGRAGSGGGDLQPTNPACVAAVAQGGKQPLWDWYGNLISNAAGRHREIIPDGDLCGPTTKYDAYNQPRADWPVTQVTANATVTLRYNAWAPHPGTWEQYVTKDGFDVTKPLKWSDLEPVPFDKITNPPLGNGEYSWQARLPNKSGRHIIYSLWQRSDSPEAFYSCSDVVFGGGVPDTQPPTAPGTPVASSVTGSSVRLDWPASSDNFGVAEYRVYRGDQVVATSTTNSVTVRGLAPDTEYSFRVVATDSAGNASPSSPGVTVRTGSGSGTGACTVTYTKPSTWNNGFTANVKIANGSSEAVRAWELVWDMPSGQRVSQAWSSTITVVDGKATAKGASYNADISAGGTVEFGFNAATTGAVTDPVGFTLNGVSCAIP
ncbi:putative carbohydrate-binding protein with CBM5 and CBM33 domain [Lentzea atacamensis]|uniref:Lytic polysaccharide monooxygenase n=2 Tax=Lentzea TaxID=165301 RepID=A0ABP7BIA2_9PSEU|nr:lytic polysaccharide monooxygenase [Lentzea atacamensis]PWK85597.1 putative carbohydrate-binding protein with CBM5 and CBM33 domain [Lentzea atacamensis]